MFIEPLYRKFILLMCDDSCSLLACSCLNWESCEALPLRDILPFFLKDPSLFWHTGQIPRLTKSNEGLRQKIKALCKWEGPWGSKKIRSLVFHYIRLHKAVLMQIHNALWAYFPTFYPFPCSCPSPSSFSGFYSSPETLPLFPCHLYISNLMYL